MGYPLQRLFEEVAHIAYHFHWPHHEIMALDHRERLRWVAEVSRINTQLNERSARGR